MTDNQSIIKPKEFLTTQRDVLAPLIPRNAREREFLNSAIMAIDENRNMRDALQTDRGRSTLLSALKRAAVVGLPIDPAHKMVNLACYREEGGGYKIEYQIMKDGYIELALRDGHLAEFRTRVIYENDQFEMGENEKGDTYSLKKAIDDPGAIRGFLAVGKLPDGTVRTLYMSRSQMDDWADRFGTRIKKGKNAGQLIPLWTKTYEGAGQKTVARQLLTKLKIATPQDDYDPDPREVVIEKVERGTSSADVRAVLEERTAIDSDPSLDPAAESGGGARWHDDDAPISEPEPGDLM